MQPAVWKRNRICADLWVNIRSFRNPAFNILVPYILDYYYVFDWELFPF